MKRIPGLTAVVLYRRTPCEELFPLFETLLHHVDEVLICHTGGEVEGQEALGHLLFWWNNHRSGKSIRVAQYVCPYNFELAGKGYIGDFGAAREFAHQQVTTSWSFMIDVGDELEPVPLWGDNVTLSRALQLFLSDQKRTDAVSLVYRYQGTRLVQNRVCFWNEELDWEWVYPLHEERHLRNGAEPHIRHWGGPLAPLLVHHGDPAGSAVRNLALLEQQMTRSDIRMPLKLQLAWGVMRLERDPKGAEHWLSIVRDDNPTHDSGYIAALILARRQLERGEFAAALRMLGGAEALRPEVGLAFLLHAQILELLNRDTEASAIYAATFFEKKHKHGPEFGMYFPDYIEDSKRRALSCFIRSYKFEDAEAIAKTRDEYREVTRARAISEAALDIQRLVSFYLSYGLIDKAEKVLDTVQGELALAPVLARPRALIRQAKVSAEASAKEPVFIEIPSKVREWLAFQLDPVDDVLGIGKDMAQFVGENPEKLRRDTETNRLPIADDYAIGSAFLNMEPVELYHSFSVEGSSEPPIFFAIPDAEIGHQPSAFGSRLHGYTVHDLGRIEHLHLRSVQRIDGWLCGEFGIFSGHTEAGYRGRVDILAQSPTTWGPEAHLRGGVGGSEQAVIHLTPLLGRLGWEVHVYADKLEETAWVDGVYWHHAAEFSAANERDVLVVWRDHRQAKALIRHAGCPVAYWSHDVPDPKNAENYQAFDEVWALSKYHENLFQDLGCGSIRRLANGIVADAFEDIHDSSRNPNAIYCSSGGRGLLPLLNMWPRVREQVPDAVLHVCYSFDLLRSPHTPKHLHGLADKLERLMESLPGVVYHGGMAHSRLLDLMGTCSVHAYPTWFPEISCIVMMESQSSGCQPVTTNRAALAETCLVKEQTHWASLSADCGASPRELTTGEAFECQGTSRIFINRLVEALRNPYSAKQRANLAALARSSYDWSNAAALFSAALDELKEKDNARNSDSSRILLMPDHGDDPGPGGD